jgi:hypothetical protein
LNQARNQKKIETHKHLVNAKEYDSLGDDYYNDVLGHDGTHRPWMNDGGVPDVVEGVMAEEKTEPAQEICAEETAKLDLE